MKTNIPYYAFSDVLTIVNGRNQRKVEDKKGLFPIYGSGGIMGWANDYICPENTVVIGRKGSINNPIFVEKKFWNVDTAFGLVAKQTILLPKYLYYFCVNFNFESLNTTVTIPSLTKANLLKVQIPIPSISKQEKIVLLLDKIGSLICIRKWHLDKLNQLASSRFIEMFGDLEKEQPRWPVANIGDLFDVGSSKRVFQKDWKNAGVPFYRAREIVKLEANGFVNNELFISEEMYGEYARLYGIPKAGDILVTGVGTLGVCYLVKHNDRFYYKDGNIICLHSRGKISSRFVCECYKLPFIKKQIQINAGGSTVGTYTIENARKTRIIVPPYDLQKAFIAFIEQLDKSKVTIQKSLDKLNLLYKALLQEYFG